MGPKKAAPTRGVSASFDSARWDALGIEQDCLQCIRSHNSDFVVANFGTFVTPQPRLGCVCMTKKAGIWT